MHKSVMAAMAAASLLALSACRQTTVNGNATGNATAENASAAAAGDVISGTWKADLSTVQIEQQPDQFLLQGGQYSCKTCPSPYTVAADGAFHAINGPYADHVAIKVVDDHTILRTSQKGARQIGETKITVSADGKMLTAEFTDTSTPNAPAVKGKYTETRVAPAPAGAHLVSGSWKPAKIENVSDEGLTVTYKLDADTLHMSTPAGQSFDAKLDGTDAPIKGDIAGTTASVKKTGDNSFEETDKRDGKVVGIGTFTVGAEGKMAVIFDDKVRKQITKYVANKQ